MGRLDLWKIDNLHQTWLTPIILSLGRLVRFRTLHLHILNKSGNVYATIDFLSSFSRVNEEKITIKCFAKTFVINTHSRYFCSQKHYIRCWFLALSHPKGILKVDILWMYRHWSISVLVKICKRKSQNIFEVKIQGFKVKGRLYISRMCKISNIWALV